MKKILIILSLLISTTGFGQYLTGLSNSNFGGTNMVYSNPAKIADARDYVYINLITTNFNISQNFLTKYNSPYNFKDAYKLYVREQPLPAEYLTDNGKDLIFKESYLNENFSGAPITFSISNEIRGPSIMISPDNKNSIAFTTRHRLYVQGWDISPNIVKIARFGLDKVPELYNILINDNHFNISVNSFAEAGLSYGRVVMDQGEHFLKAGITAKKLYGFGSAYVLNNNVEFQLINNDSAVFQEYDLSYGYTDEQYFVDAGIEDQENYYSWFMNDFKPLGKGLGLDFGVVYEWRPNYQKYLYTMNGKERVDNRRNKYKAKVGFAIGDIGRIKYEDDKYVYSYQALHTDPNDVVKWGELTKVKVKGKEGFNELVDSIFTVDASSNSFTVTLPTFMNIYGEYNIWGPFYANAQFIKGIRRREKNGIKQYDQFSLTPRVETRWAEFSLPILFTQNFRSTNIGAFLRLGPVFVGSDNIGIFMGGHDTKLLDIYAGACIPIGKMKKRDKDGDQVSNWKDDCKKVPGTYALNGCPDADEDGITDAEDECPAEAGSKLMKGCPDRDGDGIADKDDECPDSVGLEITKGCPDEDGDGVADKDDECPDVAGPVAFAGCPDSDSDSIPDHLDKCPELAGTILMEGCPDADNDGVPEYRDSCESDSGSVANYGCPEDKKPDLKVKTVVEKDVVTEKDTTREKDVANQVKVFERDTAQINPRPPFENFYFDFNSSYFKWTDYKELKKLVAYMKENPDVKMEIYGYADPSGTEEYNKWLSDRRANRITDYLVKNGIARERIESQGKGVLVPRSDQDPALSRKVYLNFFRD